MWEMCRFVISIVLLSTAAAAPVQPPAATKMLNLFQALQTSQHRDSQRVSFSLTE
jgi:N-acyl-L-homoserine lactone synthetase